MDTSPNKKLGTYFCRTSYHFPGKILKICFSDQFISLKWVKRINIQNLSIEKIE